MGSDFVHLHNHSVYSLLDGLCTPEAMAERAKEYGYDAIAVTDHGSVTGHLRFVRACAERGIKPILGVEAYFVDDVAVRKKGEVRRHIVLIALNEKGWRNLLGLMTEANLNKYYKPRIDPSLLRKYSDGIIVSTACMKGVLSHPNWEKLARTLQAEFGDRFVVEMMPLDDERQMEINERAAYFHSKFGAPIVITGDVHYINEGDSEFHNFLLSLNTHGKLEFDHTGFYLRSPADMLLVSEDVLSEVPGADGRVRERAYATTHLIAESVSLDLRERPIRLPKVVDGDADAVLKQRVSDALSRFISERRKNGGMPTPEARKYIERYRREYSVITGKGFSDYFLMVADMVSWAKERGMEVGPGRGSAGGSLVSFLLGITEIDPVEHDLLFERFLNPDRTDYPDIDVDFQMTRRREVLDYLRRKYGEDRVANISTLSEQKPKSAFKDVARYFNVPFDVSNAFTTMLEGAASISEELRENAHLTELAGAIPNREKIIRLADGICGTLRHVGKHAAGVVISPEPLRNSAVLEENEEGHSVNWEMDDVSHLGWVKVDVLGLRTLDILSLAKELVHRERGVDIDWSEVDIYDKESYSEFGRGHTVGLFQFESGLVSGLCRELAPIEKFDTLVDINALARPGPLDSGMTESYISRYHMMREKGKYLDTARPYADHIMSICSDTFNVVLYQEQIMRIAVELAGYTVAESDQLRKIVAKSKGSEEFEHHREKFCRGCVRVAGMNRKAAEALFEDLQKYSRYSFNRSHAAAYTIVALRQMYLKRHYPAEYMAALYTYTPNEEKRQAFTAECRRLGISVHTPDINRSDRGFTLRGGELWIGLEAVKGVGKAAVDEILEGRKAGPYRSLEDFRGRVSRKAVSKRVLESLLLVGAFDSFGVNKKGAVDNMRWLHRYYDYVGGKKLKGFDPAPPEPIYAKSGDYSKEEDARHKTELLPGVFALSAIDIAPVEVPAGRMSRLRDVVSKCRRCTISNDPSPVLPSWDKDRIRLVVVGEAPGEREEKEGIGFVGKAGKRLFSDLKKAGFKREDCYVTNVFKCRPPGNKLPAHPPETCYAFLEKELEILRPGLVLSLGGTAMRFFRRSGKEGVRAVSDIATVRLEKVGNILVPVLYNIHPAAVIRGGDENIRVYRKVMDRLAQLKEESDG